jgi:hemin uptake protein HemP
MVEPSEDEPKPAPGETPTVPPEVIRLIRSEDLLAGAQEILIEHDGQTYRLRLTRSGKLILHK